LRLIAITPPAHRGKTRTLRQQGPSPRKLVPAKAGAGTHTQAASHEDTSFGHTPRARAWRVRLGHMTTPSSPFNQHPPRRSSTPPGAQLPRASPNAGALKIAHATPAARPQPGLRPWWR